MHYKIPQLEGNGTLTQENAVSVYSHYLNSDRVDYDGIKRKPTKVSILHAMLRNHSPNKNNLIQRHLDAGKKVYFWSDQHFGHSNIIKYANRPFEDKGHMDRIMIENYFNTIKNDDLVVWVGDVAFSGVTECRQMLGNLPGAKVLIMGNHDFDKKYNFKDFGIFQEVYMATVFNMAIEEKVCNLIVSHYPIQNELLPENTLNIHGHIHDKTADIKNINVSVEKTEYRPIDITNIITEKFMLVS